VFNKNKTVLVLYPVGKTDVSFIIPGSVTGIGSNAFEGCASLSGITIPDGVTNIGDSAFRGCTGLTSVIIGKDVNTIWMYAFVSCTNLTSVTFQCKFSQYDINFPYAFDGDLCAKHLKGGIGTYTRASGGSTWTKVN